MKTAMSKKPKTAAKPKRTGPSQRTQAERDAINKRAAASRKPKATKAPKPRPIINMPGQPTRWPRDIEIGARHRKDMGDLASLARSIDERGALLQPIVITPANKLIAGQRRLEAWKLSKFKKEAIPVCVVDIDAIVMGERDENAQRKDFTPTEAVAIKREIEEFLQAKADARPTAMRAAPGRKAEEGGRAADKAAGYVGKDRRTIERAEKIIEAAERDPERFGNLVEDMNRTGKVNGPFKRLQVLTQVDDINARKANGTLAVPEGKFDRIVADMPWPYEADDETPAERGRAVRGYATMSIKEMKALPIADRCADSTVLYFWVTNFHMEYAYQVMRAWGFAQFPTIVTWAKDKFGKGQRLRCATEHCIIAIKGKPIWNLANQTTRLDGPVREDSRKPDEFYALIDAITPAERSLELFARRELPEGWVGFGDQVGTLKDEPAKAPQNITENITAEPPWPYLTELQALETIEAGREIDINTPVVASLKAQKLARGGVKLKLTKAGMNRLEVLRKEEYSKFDDSPPPDRGDDDQVQEDNLSQVDCRVCAVGAGLCAECIAAADHVITTGFDGAAEPASWAAICSCGFSCSGDEPAVAAAVKAHWQNVVTEAKAAAASEPAPDPMDIPPRLRRAPVAEAAE